MGGRHDSVARIKLAAHSGGVSSWRKGQGGAQKVSRAMAAATAEATAVVAEAPLKTMATSSYFSILSSVSLVDMYPHPTVTVTLSD